jgi:MFS family permease
VGLFLGTCLATLPNIASNNLLPKAVCLHAAGAVSATLVMTSRRWGSPGWLVVALVGWMAAQSIVFGGDTVGPTLDAVSALAVMLAVAAGVGTRRMLTRLFVGVAFANALLALIDGAVPLGLGEGTRPAGLLGSRATAGAFTAAALALAVSTRLRWPGTISLVTLAAMVVATRARAAWAATMLVVFAASHQLRSWRVLTACSVGALLVVAVPLPSWRWVSPTPWRDSLSSLLRLDVGDRAEVWGESLSLVSTLGHGIGGFEARFPTAREARTRVESPHLEPLHAVIELGVGVLALAGLLGLTLVPRRGRTARGVWWAWMAILVCSVTGKTFSEPPTLIFGAVLAGLLLRVRLRRVKRVSTLRAAAAVTGLGLLASAAAVDSRQLAASQAQHDAEALRAQGHFRAAWERLEPHLDDARDMGPWLTAFDLLRDVTDTRRCESLAARARARWPVGGLLQAKAHRCADAH